MDFEEQLLIGGLLMTIAVLSASHAHAGPIATHAVRTEMTISASGQHVACFYPARRQQTDGLERSPCPFDHTSPITLSRPENRNASPAHAAP